MFCEGFSVGRYAAWHAHRNDPTVQCVQPEPDKLTRYYAVRGARYTASLEVGLRDMPGSLGA